MNVVGTAPPAVAVTVVPAVPLLRPGTDAPTARTARSGAGGLSDGGVCLGGLHKAVAQEALALFCALFALALRAAEEFA